MTLPIVQTDIPPSHIDLGSGNPSLDLLPIKLLQQASERYFSSGDRRTLQYGDERGNGYFLAALTNFLSSNLQLEVPTEALFATNGASAALDLICTLYTDPGDLIFVEEPTYFLARGIFSDHKLRVQSISIDHQGLIVDELENKLAQYKPKLLYTIPTFHNPASVTLSRDRRERLVKLARQYGFLIVADEVYQFLSYESSPPKPFAAFTGEIEQVISVNSFSKILAPGLRLGWIQAHPNVINRLSRSGLLDSGGGLNPFTSALVSYLIESGDLADNIRKLKGIYQQRLDALADSLGRHLPIAEYGWPQGGYYFWVRLPGKDTGKIRELARKRKVDFRHGSLFSSREGLQEYLRLSFSYYDTDQIETGVRRIAESVKQA